MLSCSSSSALWSDWTNWRNSWAIMGLGWPWRTLWFPALVLILFVRIPSWRVWGYRIMGSHTWYLSCPPNRPLLASWDPPIQYPPVRSWQILPGGAHRSDPPAATCRCWPYRKFPQFIWFCPWSSLRFLGCISAAAFLIWWTWGSG